LHRESDYEANPYDITLLEIRATRTAEFAKISALVDQHSTLIFARHPLLVRRRACSFDPRMNSVRDIIHTITGAVINGAFTKDSTGEDIAMIGTWIIRILPGVFWTIEAVESFVPLYSCFDWLVVKLLGFSRRCLR
jgi:hypothetical protein